MAEILQVHCSAYHDYGIVQIATLLSQTKTQNKNAKGVESGIQILRRLEGYGLGVQEGDWESQGIPGAELA